MPNKQHEIRAWSPEEEARLVVLFDSGETASEIGRQLGRTSQAIYWRLLRFRKQQGRVNRTSGHAFAQWSGD
jgi:transposase-like protein